MYIKSPLNYTGGKYRVLNQIIPLFPNKINNFVDLFCGGLNVGLNINANNYYFNDVIYFLIDMYEVFKQESLDNIISYIKNTINKNNLTVKNKVSYVNFRKKYNESVKYPLDLFILICFSFNNQIRYNKNHDFNCALGKSFYSDITEQNLIKFILKIQEIKPTFSSNNFIDFDFDFLMENDFVYLDPPYLITNATYNEKRGFDSWNNDNEIKLLSILDKLNEKNIKFALSNVLENKNKKNNILIEWINDNKYNVNNINIDYYNSNYQIKDKQIKTTTEVIITNYNKENNIKQLF